MVDRLVAAGVAVNATGRDMMGAKEATPLHVASDYGQIQVVRRLLGLGANVNARDSVGSSALFTAAGGAHADVDVVKLLIDKGADVNARDKFKDTPFHIACLAGRMGVVRALLGAGASVNAIDQAGDSPLQLAVHRGDVELLRVLLEAGADPTIKRVGGQSLAEWARERGREDIAVMFEQYEQRQGATGSTQPAQ
jgi:ankyrin repeat protein